MSAPAKCPGCGTKLQPDWESCPNCPMSFLDAAPEKSAFQNDSFRSIGMPMLFFGGLAFVIWTMGQFFWRTAVEGTKTVAIDARLPVTSIVKGGGVVPSDSRGIQALVDEQRAGKREPVGEAPPPADEGPGTISIMPDESARKSKAVTEWRMRGAIYDLVTLNPVPNVTLNFIDNETNSRAQIQTDTRGRYRTVLPPLTGCGYIVTIAKDGYQKSYLDPGTEGVREMSLERRSEISKELAALVAEPAMIEPNSDAPLQTDFYLAPK